MLDEHSEGDFKRTDVESALAGMNLRGEGMPKNPAEAERWVRRAAEAGDPQAMEALRAGVTQPRR